MIRSAAACRSNRAAACLPSRVWWRWSLLGISDTSEPEWLRSNRLVRAPRTVFIGDMRPCHVVPAPRPGKLIDAAPSDPPAASAAERCDHCDSDRLEWRTCKLICANCRQITKSCADL